MIYLPRKNHVVPTIMLCAAACLPLTPLAMTNSAYGDTETSTDNMFAASTDFSPRIEVEVSPLSLRTALPEGEVAGTTTIEVSDEPLEIEEPATSTSTPEKDLEIEVSDEPLEVVGPTETPQESTPAEEEPAPTEPEEVEEIEEEESTPEPEEDIEEEEAPEPEITETSGTTE